jgi:radical SAM superfamily enzyme YgiQ (UPF0313 family)
VRVALVNPNRYRRPPVPPVGLEYLVAPLRRAGHEPVIVDLCFAPEPRGALVQALDEARADAVGFTVRNVDTVLYHTNESFLEEIAALVEPARAAGVPVLVGGSGVGAMPEPVRRALGADYAVDGPGEAALPALLDTLAAGRNAPPVMDGWGFPFDPSLRHPRGELVDYAPYLAAGARFGFETQKGCTGRCLFCTEAARPVRPRRPNVVADEVAALAKLAATQLFCCDSEFNQSLEGSKAFLRELVARALPVDWTLYMKPLPHDAALFELLTQSGCSSLTFSADTLSLYGPEPAYAEADLVSFLDLAARAGLKVAVDLTVGLPDEPDDAPHRAIELFRCRRPSTVGVNAYLRLYPGAGLLGRVLADAQLRRRIEPPDRQDYAQPAFYHHLDDAALERLIAGDPLFRIEGREPGVNYERV